MGYTNYWKFTDNPKNIENGAEKFKNAVNAAKDCIGRVRNPLRKSVASPCVLATALVKTLRFSVTI